MRNRKWYLSVSVVVTLLSILAVTRCSKKSSAATPSSFNLIVKEVH